MKALPITALLLSLQVATAGAEPIYFLVTPLDYLDPASEKESFVVPIDDAGYLEEARHLVELASKPGWPGGPRPPTILIATAAKGSNAINRNYSVPQMPEWSWHVTKVYGFSDGCSCDPPQRPSELEALYSVHGHTNELGAQFGNYTVTRELGPTPLQLNILHQPGTTELYWSSPGEAYRFTLQTAALNPSGVADWTAVEGADWPMKTNHWKLNASTTNALFRVIAVKSVVHAE